MMDNLMVTGQNQWDSDLINDIFEETDANLMLSLYVVHITTLVTGERRSWFPSSKKRIYSSSNEWRQIKYE